jgi:hypothetical protein
LNFTPAIDRLTNPERRDQLNSHQPKSDLMKTKLNNMTGIMKCLAILTTLGISTSPSHAAEIVRWGKSGGATDISAGVSDGPVGAVTDTYLAGEISTQKSNPNYYPNATGSNPAFNADWSSSGSGTVEVRDDGQYFSVPRNGAGSLAVSYIWENGASMTADGGMLSTFTVQSRQRTNDRDYSVRFIYQDTSNNWYISEQFDFTKGGGFNEISVDARRIKWFVYTPFVGGTDKIGSAATPTLRSYKAVGFRTLDPGDDSDSAIDPHDEIRNRYFQVTTTPD